MRRNSAKRCRHCVDGACMGACARFFVIKFDTYCMSTFGDEHTFDSILCKSSLVNFLMTLAFL